MSAERQTPISFSVTPGAQAQSSSLTEVLDEQMALYLKVSEEAFLNPKAKFTRNGASYLDDAIGSMGHGNPGVAPHIVGLLLHKIKSDLGIRPAQKKGYNIAFHDNPVVENSIHAFTAMLNQMTPPIASLPIPIGIGDNHMVGITMRVNADGTGEILCFNSLGRRTSSMNQFVQAIQKRFPKIETSDVQDIQMNPPLQDLTAGDGYCGHWTTWFFSVCLQHPNLSLKKIKENIETGVFKPMTSDGHLVKHGSQFVAENLKRLKDLRETQLANPNSRIYSVQAADWEPSRKIGQIVDFEKIRNGYEIVFKSKVPKNNRFAYLNPSAADKKAAYEAFKRVAQKKGIDINLVRFSEDDKKEISAEFPEFITQLEQSWKKETKHEATAKESTTVNGIQKGTGEIGKILYPLFSGYKVSATQSTSGGEKKTLFFTVADNANPNNIIMQITYNPAINTMIIQPPFSASPTNVAIQGITKTDPKITNPLILKVVTALASPMYVNGTNPEELRLIQKIAKEENLLNKIRLSEEVPNITQGSSPKEFKDEKDKKDKKEIPVKATVTTTTTTKAATTGVSSTTQKTTDAQLIDQIKRLNYLDLSKELPGTEAQNFDEEDKEKIEAKIKENVKKLNQMVKSALQNKTYLITNTRRPNVFNFYFEQPYDPLKFEPKEGKFIFLDNPDPKKIEQFHKFVKVAIDSKDLKEKKDKKEEKSKEYSDKAKETYEKFKKNPNYLEKPANEVIQHQIKHGYTIVRENPHTFKIQAGSQNTLTFFTAIILPDGSIKLHKKSDSKSTAKILETFRAASYEDFENTHLKPLEIKEVEKKIKIENKDDKPLEKQPVTFTPIHQDNQLILDAQKNLILNVGTDNFNVNKLKGAVNSLRISKSEQSIEGKITKETQFQIKEIPKDDKTLQFEQSIKLSKSSSQGAVVGNASDTALIKINKMGDTITQYNFGKIDINKAHSIKDTQLLAAIVVAYTTRAPKPFILKMDNLNLVKKITELALAHGIQNFEGAPKNTQEYIEKLKKSQASEKVTLTQNPGGKIASSKPNKPQ